MRAEMGSETSREVGQRRRVYYNQTDVVIVTSRAVGGRVRQAQRPAA